MNAIYARQSLDKRDSLSIDGQIKICKKFAARVKDNYFHRFLLVALPGGPAPYGFDLTKISTDGKTVLGGYISKEIERLHKEREALKADRKETYVEIGSINFKALSFDERKIVAAQFIDKILINGKNVNIVWKI